MANPGIRNKNYSRGNGTKTKRAHHFDKLLHKKCSEYLHNNFHKFSQDHKIAIAKDMVKKFGTTKLDDAMIDSLTPEAKQRVMNLYGSLCKRN
jgi:hypothetical protein